MAAKKKIEPVENVAKKAVTKKTAKSGLSAPLFDKQGGQSTINLNEAVFGVEPNKVLLAQAVRVFLSNQRSAQAKTKGRGEIDRSTKKIYKQKGTGGARHGARSAPIFVGGGIAHGPNGSQNYKLNFPKELRVKALISALSARAKDGQLVVADLAGIELKTKNIAELLKKANQTKGTLLVHANESDVYKAARNIKGVVVVQASLLTTYHVLSERNVLLTKAAVEVLEARMTGAK